jgi:glutathione S-transferase
MTELRGTASRNSHAPEIPSHHAKGVSDEAHISPASPFARKVRICAIELGLIDRIEMVPTAVAPGTPNEQYAHDVNPLRKLPVLILDDGTTIADSLVICEYLDDLAGGGKLMPVSGSERWKVKTEHSLLQGMLDAMLLCRYEKLLRPKSKAWDLWYDDQWDRAWQGFARFNASPDVLARPLDITQIALVCALGYADFRFPDQDWRKAFPKLAAFNKTMMKRPSVKISVPPTA